MGTALAVGAIAGAGVGFLKQAEQEKQAKAQRRLAALKTQLSGLQGSGVRAGTVGPQPSLFQNVAQGALAGAGFAAKNQSLFEGDGFELAPNSTAAGPDGIDNETFADPLAVPTEDDLPTNLAQNPQLDLTGLDRQGIFTGGSRF